MRLLEPPEGFECSLHKSLLDTQILHMVLKNRMFEWNTDFVHIEGTIHIVDKMQKGKVCSVTWIFLFLMTTLCWTIHPDNVVIVKDGHGGSNHHVLEITGTATESCYWFCHHFLCWWKAMARTSHGTPPLWTLMAGMKYIRGWGWSHGIKQLTDTLFLSWRMHSSLLDLTEQLNAMLDTLSHVNAPFCGCN